MSEITSETLADWRRICDRATKGPWRWWTSNSWRRLSSDPSGKDGDVLSPFVNQADKHPDCAVSEENQEFIAVARTAMPALLDEVDRLRTWDRFGARGIIVRCVSSAFAKSKSAVANLPDTMKLVVSFRMRPRS